MSHDRPGRSALTGATRQARLNHLLLMVADGATVEEMAQETGVARATINHDLHELRIVFGARNNCNLVALAYQKGVLNGRQFVD